MSSSTYATTERVRGYRVLTVPGLHGSGHYHWQTLWERAHPDYRRVAQRDWSNPDLDEWAAAVTQEVLSDDLPAILVAHSFGCLAAMPCGSQLACGRILGAMLVAPANPTRFGISLELWHQRLDFPTVLIASSSDPWLALVHAKELADAWGGYMLNLGNCGHINAEAGYGPWPAGERLLYEFQKTGLRHSRRTPQKAAAARLTFAV